jgi:hypothetical protein
MAADIFGRTTEQLQADAQLRAFLDQYGLGALKDRLWSYIVDQGVDDENRLMLWVAEQPEYKARFPAMESLAAKGRAISPAQYIQLERSYAQVMHEFGVPAKFFDDKGDFTALITNEVSPAELQSRVQDGFAKVANADPQVRAAFRNYFGVAGDAALAAFFIDPNRAAPKLEAAAKAAEVAGAAANMQIDLGLNEADRLARMGVSYDKAMDGFQKLSLARNLFARGVNETAVLPGATPESDLRFGDLPNEQGYTPPGPAQGPSSPAPGSSDEQTRLGVGYVFGTDGGVQRDLERRLQQRRAENFAETPNVTVDRQGRTGLGTAE